MQVLVTEQDFYDLATAYFTQAAAQNVRYAEIFFDPPAHTSRGVKFGTVLRGLRRAVVDARRTRDLHAWLIMCLLRDCSAEYAMATPMESPPYKDWIVGVGLDSDERGNPPVEFEKVFARARAEGYLLTMHCDVDQPGTLDHIRQALDIIGVDRIDHGVNAPVDPALLTEIVERGIGLTVCPISNSFVRGSAWDGATKRLLDAGVLVSVNSGPRPCRRPLLTSSSKASSRRSRSSSAAPGGRPPLLRTARNCIRSARTSAGVRCPPPDLMHRGAQMRPRSVNPRASLMSLIPATVPAGGAGAHGWFVTIDRQRLRSLEPAGPSGPSHGSVRGRRRVEPPRSAGVLLSRCTPEAPDAARLPQRRHEQLTAPVRALRAVPSRSR
jgi:adenosine deaminase